MEFHRATMLHRLPFSFAIMHLGRACGKEIFARRNRLGIPDIVLLGEIFLLQAGEKALEVFGTSLLIRFRSGLQKSLTNLRHTPTFPRSDSFQIVLQI